MQSSTLGLAPSDTFRYIRNSETLLGHGQIKLRRDALSILDRVLREVDPYDACRKILRLEGKTLTIGKLKLAVPHQARIWFFGAGKASFQIAKGVEEQLGEKLRGGLVVCKEGQEGSLRRIDVLHASHPVPSESSVTAAQEMVARVFQPSAGDIVLCGITGGSSALLTLPCQGLALEDIQLLTKILLTCGANIFEINAVRKYLSRIGGGRLAQMFKPGVCLINITVSDVIGDALDYITDPTVVNTATIDDARATLEKYSLWERIPPTVRAFLKPRGNVTETPKTLPWPSEHNVVLLSASTPVEAARRAAQDLGYSALALSTSFEGESQPLGEAFAAIAREAALRGQPIAAPCALIGGGETVVRMNSFEGLGGPNQEFALAGACHLPSSFPAVILGADTDGTDGPTQIAGAICDASTLARAKSLSIDVHSSLLRHDVTPALIALGDAIQTGATGTNVNDIKLLLIG